MRFRYWPALALVALGSCTHEPDRPSTAQGARVVDLGHALAATDPSWDGAPAFSREMVATIEKDS